MSETIRNILPGRSIKGEILIPTDKSITHRACMLAAVARGTSLIREPSTGLDCQSTCACLQSLGVPFDVRGSFMRIKGVGRQGFKMPRRSLDAGNSGSTVRMLSGLLAGNPIDVTIDGDESLRKRPLQRIVKPLKAMGADISGAAGENGEIVCPLSIWGRKNLHAVAWKSPVASAQVKTAVLFAGLNAVGKTSIHEPHLSRDHTERMLSAFGCAVKKGLIGEIVLTGPLQPEAAEITVCSDFSSAAFFIVLALLLPDSEIILPDIGINPTRIGLLPVLARMGADIKVTNQRRWSGEPIGDIVVRSSALKAVTVKEDEVPGMIDELPILAVAAARAEGTTVITGAGELKFKESNRLSAIAEGLNAMGAAITVTDDGFEIEGKEGFIGTRVNSFNDHRIAMALAVAGVCGKEATVLTNSSCVNISFPQFWQLIDKHIV